MKYSFVRDKAYHKIIQSLIISFDLVLDPLRHKEDLEGQNTPLIWIPQDREMEATAAWPEIPSPL